MTQAVKTLIGGFLVGLVGLGAALAGTVLSPPPLVDEVTSAGL